MTQRLTQKDGASLAVPFTVDARRGRRVLTEPDLRLDGRCTDNAPFFSRKAFA